MSDAAALQPSQLKLRLFRQQGVNEVEQAVTPVAADAFRVDDAADMPESLVEIVVDDDIVVFPPMVDLGAGVEEPSAYDLLAVLGPSMQA